MLNRIRSATISPIMNARARSIAGLNLPRPPTGKLYEAPLRERRSKGRNGSRIV